jgi:hypothetical protein
MFWEDLKGRLEKLANKATCPDCSTNLPQDKWNYHQVMSHSSHDLNGKKREVPKFENHITDAKTASKFSEHPSEKDYQEYGTIKEDGKEKYPIRPGDKKDAEDALKLLHHEKNPEKRKEIREKADAEIAKDDKKD